MRFFTARETGTPPAVPLRLLPTEDDSAAREALRGSLALLAQGSFQQSAAAAREAGGELGAAVAELAGRLQQRAQETLRGLVLVSSQYNQAMVHIVEMTRAVHEVDGHSQTIASATEEMVASVQEISRTAASASQEAKRAHDATAKGMADAERAVETMNGIAHAVENAVAKVTALAEASTQIGEIVQQIESIARMTNLLALNATIEAARAGDAGKGFAVVANEVKSLANQTAKATVNIRNRIDTIQADVGAIVATMTQSASAVEDGRTVISAAGEGMRTVAGEVAGITAKMTDISAILSQQAEASGEVARGIHVIADMTRGNVDAIGRIVAGMNESDRSLQGVLEQTLAQEIPFKLVQVAKSDHVHFKKSIYEAMAGTARIDPERLADEHSCRFGQWYDGMTDPQIRNQPAFRAIAEPHRRIHAAGKAALQTTSQENGAESHRHIEQLENASQEVFRLLDDLESALRGPSAAAA
jgi:methyl-accepting chemotaxis protein